MANQKEGLRKGGWTSTQRKKLTAIVEAHHSDPKNFYFDKAGAMERIHALYDGQGGEPMVDPSTPLVPDEEMAREALLGGRVGISWSGQRCFGEEYWNPLVGLWVDAEGMDFVLDRLLVDINEPKKWPFYASDEGSFFASLRRYLYRCSPEEFDAAKKRVEPFVEALTSDDYDATQRRHFFIFAFSRDQNWLQTCLQEYLDIKIQATLIDQLAMVCTNAELAGAVLDKYGPRIGLDGAYYVFDLVEAVGGAAVDILEGKKTYGGPDRKRVESAIKIANKLKELGV